MTDEAQLPLEAQPDQLPPADPTPAEALRDAVVTRLTAEVQKTTLNAASVETIKALTQVYATASDMVQRDQWEKERYINPPMPAGSQQVMQDDDLGPQETDAEIVAEAEKALKKAKKAKKKEAK